MTETTFKNVFSQFLDRYWGAFHEALEAQSVNQKRLAESVFRRLQTEHATFIALCEGPDGSAADRLGEIWEAVEHRQSLWPDASLRHDEVVEALQLFKDIYNKLSEEGRKFSATRRNILRRAPHGTPKESLRADAAS